MTDAPELKIVAIFRGDTTTKTVNKDLAGFLRVYNVTQTLEPECQCHCFAFLRGDWLTIVTSTGGIWRKGGTRVWIWDGREFDGWHVQSERRRQACAIVVSVL